MPSSMVPGGGASLLLRQRLAFLRLGLEYAMKLSKLVQAACGCPDGQSGPPATLRERLRLARRIFLIDATWAFNAYLKKARDLLLEMEKTDDQDEVRSAIMKEGSKPKAYLVAAFISPNEIRLKVKDGAGVVKDERIMGDAQKQNHEAVAEWMQRTYEMAFSR
jgi:hypothetical protein